MSKKGKRSDRIPIILIPWDPDSTEHVERLTQQRIACGWKKEKVEDWRDLQRRGNIGLHWIVLQPSHPESPAKLQMHIERFPNEAATIPNTCKAIYSREHTLDPEFPSFLPIGHISLDGVTPDGELGTDPSKGIYSLMAFYISKPLQNAGLGGTAMDACERKAKEDFGAKIITLETISNEEMRVDSPRIIALKRTIPKITNQDWYQRRGYAVYARKENAWYDTDSTGKSWGCSGVFLRKNLI